MISTLESRLEPRLDAPTGSVTYPEWKITDFAPADAILCRNNAPLVGVAFRLVRNQIPCNYLGRNLKETLDNLVKKTQATTIEGFRERLESNQRREVSRLRAKGKLQTAANLADTYECLRVIAIFCSTVSEISSVIGKIFGTKGVTLSTIHKAKGLEWDTVWLLNRSLIPSPWARSQTALRQEANLLHVAITRAKLHLKYISI